METNGSNDTELDVPLSEGDAMRARLKGMRVADREKASVISAQLRDELVRILKDGDDKNEGAFTIAVATQVEKFAVAAREILMTEKLAQNDIASLMMMGRRKRGGISNGLSYGSMFPETNPDIFGDSDSSGVIQAYPSTENFGVQAIKQMIEAARSMSESPAKLVEALAAARQNNLTDVAAELERKLGVKKTETAPEKPTR